MPLSSLDLESIILGMGHLEVENSEEMYSESRVNYL